MKLLPDLWFPRRGAGVGVLTLLCCWTVGSLAVVSAADPLDWTYWRGPNGDGISQETGLVDDWDPKGGEGSNVAWKRDDLGGRSTPIVMNGRLYTLVRAEPETRREGEKVVCVDVKTGETLWENRFNVWLSDVPDTRVGWSSVVGDPETGNVYALGVCGYFQCINGETGETIWDYPLHEQFGLLSTYGGRTNFPIIVDDQVLISGVIIGWGEMARPTDRYISFDKRTGEVVWFAGTRPLPEDTTYSGAALSVIDGVKTLVFGSGDGAVWAFQPRTGKPMWNCDISMRGLNVSPTIVDGVIYTGHSEENIGITAMGTVIAINGHEAKGNITDSDKVMWRQDELMVGRSSPIAIGDRLYCFDDRAKLFILDRKTGEVLFERISLKDRMMRASPVYADGKLYVLTANGRWHILKPDQEEGVVTLSDGSIRQAEFHASPVVSHGAVYVQSTEGLYCLVDPEKTPGTTPAPEQPQESPVTEDPQPAQLQIIPAEVLLKPGETQKFRARVFNSRGQLLKELNDSDVEFSVQGPGQIAADGTYQAPAESNHVASYVTVKSGELTSKARLRIVPTLPWKFTFDELDDVPITWVGARYRHVLRNVDGSKAMVKITTIPKGTRSRAWMGHPDLHDYTIQADVKGARTNDQLPDIGLIAQGYTLDLMGNAQKLQIRTWDPQLRMARDVDFAWEEDKWYTIKFQASVEERSDAEGKPRKIAVLKGKVWPRGEAEPEAWSVEAIDESPQTVGSPGLFGNAKVAELYLDNIEVYPNQ
ncbi:MAG: PQQ-binding-like beta-propeller repeat protein [Pirellulaceae bacterium]|nr:PQQ-binding-like beta-propeller repeat protein [Planctomycetales bacterium]MCA9228720.1 PQQ-binding-like beta-propeller repeat protein [Planctomycetales bacterium]